MNEIALANFYRVLNNADRFPMDKELADAAIAAKDELNALRALPSDKLMGLVRKWREENGDYPESKRDCADELEALLSQEPSSGKSQ